jgi:hypothetical protein
MQVQRKERSIPQSTSAALTILCRQILYEVASLMELFLCVIAHFWHVYPNTRDPTLVEFFRQFHTELDGT